MAEIAIEFWLHFSFALFGGGFLSLSFLTFFDFVLVVVRVHCAACGRAAPQRVGRVLGLGYTVNALS